MHTHFTGPIVNSQKSESYGWHFQYLTIVGLTISTLCFASGLSADVPSAKPTVEYAVKD